MDAARLLKEEINHTHESLHDFAKWKLIIVSALWVTALGLGQSEQPRSEYWLLLLVPFACAYVDLHGYQYVLRMFVISEALRSAENSDMLIKRYEHLCEQRRHDGIFDLGSYAGISSSLAFSVLAPIYAVAELARARAAGGKMAAAIILAVIGICLIVFLFVHFRRMSAKLGSVPMSSQNGSCR